MRIKPTTIMRYFKYWPPYLACGISVKEFNLDKGIVVSQMKLSRWNANAFGTMFGGSLYSMCDPFYVFILAHKLGKEYYIWDVESNIKFIKATKNPVMARFEVTEEEYRHIKEKADSGDKVIQDFSTNIIDDEGRIIAEVKKKVYVKAKKR